MISVENVLSENLPSLESHPFIRKRILPFLRQLLHEGDFKSFDQKYSHLQGFDFIDQVLEHFDFSYSLRKQLSEIVFPLMDEL
ncbi:hypothetical protein ACLKMH_08210 [Psychromonas sp. KJ10-10]|uniref:hypothetical protein n=1 Tax=Psychromonas sp. KJ10-10 TaxID=3391823 RepID=UPI0039B6012B